MNPTVQILTPKDLDKLNDLISVFEKVFEMEPIQRPDRTYLHKLLSKENFMAIVAVSENKVIGGLTIYVLDRYYSEKPSAYIYDLAVRTEYQRKGVGKKLIAFTNDHCRQNGFAETYVQADKQDTDAIDFYRLTNPTLESEVVHFTYNLVPED